MAIANVQTGAKVTSAATGTVTGTLPGVSTAGNLLVALIGTNSAGFAFAGPSNWVQADKSAFADDCAVFYLSGNNNPGGQSSFIFTDTSGGNMTVEVSEWSGADAAAPLRVHANGSGNAIGITASVAGGVSGDLAVAVAVKAVTARGLAAGAGFTQVLLENAFSGGAASVEGDTQLNIGTGTVSDAVTDAGGAAANWDWVIAVFKPSAAAAAGVVPSGQRSMDQSREWLLMYRVRRTRRFDVIRPQVNPPMPPTWWRRPFLATNRFFVKRARISVPIRPQVNPPFSNDWWRRAFQIQARKFLRRAPFRYDLPIRAQVNPPLPPAWWRRPFVAFPRAIAPRKARRFEVTRPQLNPPFSTDWWKRPITAMQRALAPRKARRSEPGWGQAATSATPSFVAWATRLRRGIALARRRGASPLIPTPLDIPAPPRRARIPAVLWRRRGRDVIALGTDVPARLRRVRPLAWVRRRLRQGPPLVTASAPANPSLVIGRWRRVRAQMLRPRRALISFVPVVAVPLGPLVLLAVTGFSRAQALIGSSRAAILTGLSRAKSLTGRSRAAILTGLSRIYRISGRTR